MKQVLISGDCVCDHNVYKGKRRTADSSETRGVIEKQECGGAMQLQKLISETLKASGLSKWQADFGFGPELGGLPAKYHAFCLWEPQVNDPSAKIDDQCEVWRAVEPPLGYGHPGSPSPSASCSTRCGKFASGKSSRKGTPEIVVLDDADLGFREKDFDEHWSLPSKTKKSPSSWVVLKLSGSVGQGDLWEQVEQKCRHNLVVVVSADQLRRADVRISRGLSWEATVEDLVSELDNNAAVKPLLTARHLVVTFGLDGALWIDNPPSEDKQSSKPTRNAKTEMAKRSSMLVFDAANAEGEWESKQSAGTVFGYQSCMVAAIVRELCQYRPKKKDDDEQDGPDFETAIVAGLSAARKLRQVGHGPVLREKKENKAEGEADEKPDKPEIEVNPNPGFPFECVAKAMLSPNDDFVSTPIPTVLKNRGDWMMLNEWQVRADSKTRRPHYEAALALAVLGPSALERFPVARFGGLQTVDRKEIESLRTIRKLINDYETGGKQKQPLCIGVFGPPGAGKSFGVKQISRAVLGDNVKILTFNLSQFTGPEEIVGALHQVRDVALKQTTPVVFWDEFDSLNYKWLQYLLAPMQDGAFQDGPITHPIGKSVFIFAGATSQTYESFGPVNPADMETDEFEKAGKELEKDWRHFVLHKGPDFKSRLVGYLNVMGPNVREECEVKEGRRFWEESVNDIFFPIRRALFIRAQFKLRDKRCLDLDMGVLRAMLETPRYKAGSRSLVFLCKHLQRDAAGRVPTRSNLPGRQLLDMHVDADRFWEICERDLVLLRQIEPLARDLHEDWRKIPSSEDNDLNKPWDDLTDGEQSASKQQVLRISRNLAIVGLRIEQGPPLSAAKEKEVKAHMQECGELMAEAEHNGWMAERMIDGWRYANIPVKDSERKLHPLLIPYAQLPELQKEKDRRPILGFTPTAAQKKMGEEPVLGYIEMLNKVGFRIGLHRTKCQVNSDRIMKE